MYKTVEDTLFIGKNLVFVPECPSTNDLAISLLRSPTSTEGTVVITNRQTSGRGQRGNQWLTEPGQNLTFSVLLKPHWLPVKNQFFLTTVVSLALHDLLRDFGVNEARVKWPNDLVVGEKKIGGILIENQVQGDAVTTSVVGIGFNVNQLQFAVSTATSLSLTTGMSHSLEGVLQSLLGKIEARYLQLRNGKHAALLDDYLAVMHRYQQVARYLADGAIFEGTIIGVDEWGKLKVQTSGSTRLFGLKEIQYV